MNNNYSKQNQFVVVKYFLRIKIEKWKHDNFMVLLLFLLYF